MLQQSAKTARRFIKPETVLNIAATICCTVIFYRIWPAIINQFGNIMYPREYITSKAGTYSPVAYFTKKIESLDTHPIAVQPNDFVLSIPEIVGGNDGVETIRIGHNPIETLPDTIGNLISLKYIYVQNTRLKSLPPSIANLTGLIELDVRGNQLRTIPDAFSNLQKLEVLNLSYNRITSLPPSIAQLSKLTYLDVTGNNLTEFPKYLPPNLESLYIGGNRIPARELEAAQVRFAQSNLIIFY